MKIENTLTGKHDETTVRVGKYDVFVQIGSSYSGNKGADLVRAAVRQEMRSEKQVS